MRLKKESGIQCVLNFVLKMNHAFSVPWILLVMAAVSASFPPFFRLDETQAMYFLSSIPQVIAGLAGLTIAGYAIVAEGLRRLAEEMESVKAAVGDMQTKFRMLLLTIIAVAAAGSVACLLGIVGFSSQGHPGDWPCGLILNISGASLLASLYLIAVLVWNVSVPNLIQKASNEGTEKMTRQLEEDCRDASTFEGGRKTDDRADNELRHDANDGDNLTRFLSTFNRLDDSLVQFAMDAGCRKVKGRIGITEAVHYLMKKGYLTTSVYDCLLEVIRYRNYLVHGSDLQVSGEWVKRWAKYT